MSKILTNTTSANIHIPDVGIIIQASSQYEIPVQDYLLWSSSEDVLGLIEAGTIIVSDDLSELSVQDGLAYIKYPDFARSIRFDNSTNGFNSKNLQSAIEEARMSSSEEFSHSGVDTDLSILPKRQMIVYQEIEIEAGKELNILGELVLLD